MDAKSEYVFRSDETARRTQSTPATTPSDSPTWLRSQGVRDFVCGSAAGSIGKIFEYPCDTIKTRMQAARYNGYWDCFSQGIQHGGFRNLYRGLSLPMAGAAAENAVLFWTYGLAQNGLRYTIFRNSEDREQLPLRGLAIAGAISGALTSFVLNPIELVTRRVQARVESASAPIPDSRTGHSSKGLGILAVAKEIYKQNGWRGFWRGQAGTFLRETGGNVAYFGIYEAVSFYFKKRLPDPEKDSLAFWQQMVGGSFAGVSYNFVLYPADTIKTRIQTGNLTTVKPTYLSVGMELWRTQGLRGLYPGVGLTLVRSAVASAFIFMIYEQSKAAWNEY